MEKLIVTGGTPLQGEISIQGSKNAVLPILAACLLGEGPCELENCPEIKDVEDTLHILRKLGCQVNQSGKTVRIDAETAAGYEIIGGEAARIRSSVLFLGALLGKMRKAVLPKPGGCAIGKRPIDLHLAALERLGAAFSCEGEAITAEGNRLHCGTIRLGLPSVGATENSILAAVLLPGETRIEHAAQEPEIDELIRFLNLRGGKLQRMGDAIVIEGGRRLHPVRFQINAHEHIYSSFARGLSINGYNPNGFLEILDGMWWTIDRHLTNEQTRQSARATYLDSIKNGVTTVFDHHASFGEIKDSLFAIEDAAKEMGVRTCLCYEISDRDGMDKARAAVMENASWIKHALADDTDMIAGMMGMHAQFTISDETMELAAANKPAEVGYHIHVAEGIEDLHDCLKKYGKRIVDRLMDCNILGEKTLLAHCIYVNPHEMQLIKDTDTMVVHNPESNMGNACGCPPTMEIVHRGILTGLGTDGYTHDMTESFKVANVLHKHHLCDANAAWGEVPQMLFEGNAKIAGRYFKKPLGVLKEALPPM